MNLPFSIGNIVIFAEGYCELFILSLNISVIILFLITLDILLNYIS